MGNVALILFVTDMQVLIIDFPPSGIIRQWHVGQSIENTLDAYLQLNTLLYYYYNLAIWHYYLCLYTAENCNINSFELLFVAEITHTYNFIEYHTNLMQSLWALKLTFKLYYTFTIVRNCMSRHLLVMPHSQSLSATAWITLLCKVPSLVH